MRKISIFLMMLVTTFVFGNEILGFNSIEFGAQKEDAVLTLKSKGFKKTDCNISFDPLDGIYDIVCYEGGTFAGKENVRIYLYFFNNKFFQVEAINYGDRWDDVFDAYIDKYNLVRDKTGYNLYKGSNDVYMQKTTFPFAGGIILTNGKIQSEYENYKIEKKRKQEEENMKKQRQNKEKINNDI